MGYDSQYLDRSSQFLAQGFEENEDIMIEE